MNDLQRTSSGRFEVVVALDGHARTVLNITSQVKIMFCVPSHEIRITGGDRRQKRMGLLRDGI